MKQKEHVREISVPDDFQLVRGGQAVIGGCCRINQEECCVEVSTPGDFMSADEFCDHVSRKFKDWLRHRIISDHPGLANTATKIELKTLKQIFGWFVEDSL